jgi:hypothetical protein
MISITKENVISRPSLKFVQTLVFLKNEAFATKDVKVTHLGGTTMHQLVGSLLLVDPEKNPIRHIAHGIYRLSPKPLQSPMLIEHHPRHLT